jgi:hypothetical protein
MEMHIKKENRQIVELSLTIIGRLRDAAEYSPEIIRKLIDRINKDLDFEQHIHNILIDNIRDNMAVDVYLQHKEDIFISQREILNV